ncbi:MAG: aldose 1-epimerase [Chloroflexota bacterium]
MTEQRKKKAESVGQSIGGMLVGFDQQIFRTTPPTNELIAKADRLAPVSAAGGGTMRVGLPGDPAAPEPAAATPEASVDLLRLSAPGVEAVVDLVAGGRLSSLVIADREVLKTSGDGPREWGSFPMVPYAGRIRDATLTFGGREWPLPATLPPHAIHGTVLTRRWHVVDDSTIATELGRDWPFAGGVVQRFELAADHLTCRLELHADEPMPASIGWHPWFARRLAGLDGELELDVEPGAMYLRDAVGIATDELVPAPPGPWDDTFTDLARPPRLRWPGFLELTIESACPDWVIYTTPPDALCVEPQSAPPNALNTDPTVIGSGRPLVAEMTWRWRSLAE